MGSYAQIEAHARPSQEMLDSVDIPRLGRLICQGMNSAKQLLPGVGVSLLGPGESDETLYYIPGACRWG